MKKARYWDAQQDGSGVHCGLCSHMCRIKEGEAGLCGVRRNQGGILYAAGYGVLSSSHLDPVEKKPLYHFLPGSSTFSIGGWGCNFRCVFCQNWTISQRFADNDKVFKPSEVVDAAVRAEAPSISYTYNEPLIGMEFVADCAVLARERGLRNVAVTNGYLRGAALNDASSLIDAFNVDIKSMDDSFYRRHCGGRLDPVLKFCEEVKKAGRHLEITNLVIPLENDRPELFERLAAWVSVNLGRDVPLHFSAYHPEYRMHNPPTPEAVLAGALAAASNYLDYVYIGNVHSERGRDSICRNCGNVLISRSGYSASISGVVSGRCRGCSLDLPGFVWK